MRHAKESKEWLREIVAFLFRLYFMNYLYNETISYVH